MVVKGGRRRTINQVIIGLFRPVLVQSVTKKFFASTPAYTAKRLIIIMIRLANIVCRRHQGFCCQQWRRNDRILSLEMSFPNDFFWGAESWITLMILVATKKHTSLGGNPRNNNNCIPWKKVILMHKETLCESLVKHWCEETLKRWTIFKHFHYISFVHCTKNTYVWPVQHSVWTSHKKSHCSSRWFGTLFICPTFDPASMPKSFFLSNRELLLMKILMRHF